MNYLEANLTREDREQQQRDILELRKYILALKQRDLGGELICEMCGCNNKPFDIHHKTYKKDLTYYDLQLLCEDCHKSITDYRHVSLQISEQTQVSTPSNDKIAVDKTIK